MKLKKIAALALAGVMAVSMLAGCAGKGTTNNDKNDTTTTSLSASVIAALSSDTTKKVTFTESDKLDAAVSAVVKKYGDGNLDTNLSAAHLNEVNKDISTDSALASLNTVQSQGDIDHNVAKSSVTYVVGSTAVPAGASVDYAVKQLAKQIDSKVSTLTLTAQSPVYTIGEVSGRITYTYTGNVSVYTHTDSVTGVVSYHMVYTVTRTGADAKV